MGEAGSVPACQPNSNSPICMLGRLEVGIPAPQPSVERRVCVGFNEAPLYDDPNACGSDASGGEAGSRR